MVELYSFSSDDCSETLNQTIKSVCCCPCNAFVGILGFHFSYRVEFVCVVCLCYCLHVYIKTDFLILSPSIKSGVTIVTCWIKDAAGENTFVFVWLFTIIFISLKQIPTCLYCFV